MVYLLLSLLTSSQSFALGESRHSFRAPSSPLSERSPSIHLNQTKSLGRCDGTLKLTSVAMIQLKVEGSKHCSNLSIPAIASSAKLTDSGSGRDGVLELPADVFKKRSEVRVESNRKGHQDVFTLSPRGGERTYSLRSCEGTLTIRPIQKVNVGLNDVRFCTQVTLAGQVHQLRTGFPGMAGDFSVSFEELSSNPVIKVSSWSGIFEDRYHFKRFNRTKDSSSQREDCSEEVVQAALDKVGYRSQYDRAWRRAPSQANFLRRSKKGNLVYEVNVPSDSHSRRLDRSFEVVADPSSCEVRSIQQLTEND